MIFFIGDGADSQYVNLARVRRVTIAADRTQTTFELDDGKRVTFSGDCSHEIPTAQNRIIPAEPGYEMVTLWAPEGQPEEIDRDPVIAWSLGCDGDPEPITPWGGRVGDDRDDAVSAVLCPSGVVVQPQSRRCKDLDSWLTEARTRLAHLREMKKHTA